MNADSKALGLIIVLLLAITLACSPLGLTTSEPTEVVEADTPVPAAPTDTPPPTEPAAPTDTPSPAGPAEPSEPTSPPRPKGATLEVINDSGRDIWYLYVSPSDADEWGEDRLGEDTIPAGTTYVVSGLPDGAYDVQARDENDDVVETVWEIEIRGSTTWEISGLATLEVVNTSMVPISKLYLSPSEDDMWGVDLLGGDTIPVEGSYVLEDIEPGLYDVRVEDADGNVIEIIYGVSLDSDYYWNVVGKVDLPANAVLRFEDAFSDNRNNWGLDSPEGASFNPPANGEFCIQIIDSQMTAWEWYEPFRPDQFVAELACTIKTNTDSSCGLGFGPDGDNLYWFEVSPYDQTYALFLLLDDEWQSPLIGWTPSSNIQPGGWNYLSLERMGGLVSVFINGVLQDTIESSHFPTGRIGLGGATYEDGWATVCIDHLRVWRME